MAIPFLGGFAGGGAGGFLGGAMRILSYIFLGLVLAIPVGVTTFVIMMSLQERLIVAVIGVKGKIMKCRVVKKNNNRFLKIKGRTLLVPYPPDECTIPISKTKNMAIMRQAGDDYLPYNIANQKLTIGDNRLMRQQHAQTIRETLAKYEQQSWISKAAPYFGFALFAIMTIMFLVVGKGVICGN